LIVLAASPVDAFNGKGYIGSPCDYANLRDCIEGRLLRYFLSAW
jgi:hypothetical protein